MDSCNMMGSTYSVGENRRYNAQEDLLQESTRWHHNTTFQIYSELVI